MAQEHNTQQIVMFIIASWFWRTKLPSPEKQPESVPKSKKVPLYDLTWSIDKGGRWHETKRTYNALNGKSVFTLQRIKYQAPVGEGKVYNPMSNG